MKTLFMTQRDSYLRRKRVLIYDLRKLLFICPVVECFKQTQAYSLIAKFSLLFVDMTAMEVRTAEWL